MINVTTHAFLHVCPSKLVKLSPLATMADFAQIVILTETEFNSVTLLKQEDYKQRTENIWKT